MAKRKRKMPPSTVELGDDQLRRDQLLEAALSAGTQAVLILTAPSIRQSLHSSMLPPEFVGAANHQTQLV